MVSRFKSVYLEPHENISYKSNMSVICPIEKFVDSTMNFNEGVFDEFSFQKESIIKLQYEKIKQGKSN